MKKLLLSFLTLLMLGGSLAWGGALTISGTLTIQGGAPLPENIHLSFGNSSYAGTVTINGSNYTASMSYGVYLYSGYAAPFKFGLGGSSALFDQSELSPDWFFVDASGNEVNPLEVNLAEEDVEIEQISEYEKNYTYTLNLTIKPRIKKDITVSGAITINGDAGALGGTKLLMGNSGDPSSLQEFDLSAATYSATLKEGEILFALGATGESGFLSGNNGNLSRDWFFVNGTRSVNPLAVEASEDLTQDLVIKQKTGVTLTGSLTQSVKYEPDWALGTKVFLTDGTTIWESSLEMFYSPEVHLQYTFEDVQPGTYMLSNYSVLQVYEGGYVDKILVAESQVTVAKADVTHNLVAAEDNSMIKVRFKPFANNAPHPVYPGTLAKVYLDAEVTVTKNSNKASSKANSGLGCESGCGGNDGATADLYMQKNTPYTLVVRADGYKTYTDENYTVSVSSYGYTTIEMQAGNDDDEPTATVIGKVLNGGTSNKECFDAYENVTVTLSNADESFKKTSPIKYDYNTFESLGGECFYGYEFDTVPLGEYTLTYAKDGYDTETQTINLTEAKVYKADPVTLEWSPEDFEFTGQLSYQHALDGTVFLNNAVITAYADAARTQQLATTTSDASGNWTLTVHVRRSGKVYFSFTHDKIYPCTDEKEAAYNSQGTKVTLTVSPQIVEKQPEKLGLASCSLQQTGNKVSPKVKISWTYPQELIDNYRTSTGGGTYSIEKIEVSRRIGDNTLIEIGSVAADNNHTLPATSFMDENDREGDYRLRFDQQVTYQLDIVYKYPTGTYSVSGDPNLTITLSLENAPLDTFDIEVVANNADWGTVTGGGRYVEGKTVSVGATPNDGYKFVAWKEGNTQVSTANPYTFKITANRTLTAVFTYDTVELALQPNDANMGTVTGNGKYRKNENATATATANDGYKFVAWKEGNTQVSTANPYTFKITSNRTLTAVFTYDTVELALQPNDANMGTVTGNGKYRKNENATARATAKDGYKFVAWKEGNTQVSIANPYTFKITGNRTLTAVFTYDTVELKLERNDATMGTVTGNGKYRKNENATARATANDGYKFVAWKEGNTQVSTANPYTFKITGNRTLTAVFTYDTVELTLQPNDATMGTVTGAGKYRKNHSVTATATPNDGYKFVGWNENGAQVSADAEYTFTITGNRTLTAVFTYDTVELTLERNNDAMGTVTGAGKYRKNQNVTATATANDGFVFVGWNENGAQVSTDAEYTFKITGNRTLTAVFTYDTVELTLEPNDPTMGAVTGAGKYRKNENVTVKATANDGYKFVAWKNGNTQVSTRAEYTFKITANRTLTAVFTYDTVTLTLQRNDPDMGTVTGGGKYRKNNSATAKATAKDGYKFVGWNENGSQISTENPYTFTIRGNRTLMAMFKYDTVELTLQPNDPTMGVVSGAGKYRKNENATATATAYDGYKFVNWKEGNTQVSASNPYTFKITGNRTLTAVFKYDTVTLTLQRNDPDMGTVAGGGKYRKNQSVKITATPEENHVFVAWKEGETVVSTENPYTFNITSNRTLKAFFQPDSVTLNLSVGTPGRGTVEGAAKYQKGEEVSISAIADYAAGFVFDVWKNGEEVFSREADTTFLITQDMNLAAYFKHDSVDLALSPNDPAKGRVEGAGSYRRLQSVTIKAIANTGYRWKEWRENDTVVKRATAATHTFTIQRNRNLVAVFVPDSVTLNLGVNDVAMGSVSGNGRYKRGTTARVKATPNPNYVFVKWEEKDTTVLESTTGLAAKAEFTTKQLYNDRTLKAVFKRDSAVLTVKPNNAELGSATGGGKFAKGQSVTVTATAIGDNEFLGWRKNSGETVSTDNPYTFTFTGTLTLTAHFKVPDPDSSMLTLTVNNPDMGTASARGQVGGAKFEEGETIEITANPNTGYKFIEWQENGTQLSTDNPYEVEIEANHDRSIMAVFAVKPDSVNLTLYANNDDWGVVEGEARYQKGESVVITATPSEDYVFVAWKDNSGQLKSTEATYRFNIESNLTLTAYFQPDSMDLALEVNEARMGAVAGAGRYRKGQEVTITATPNDGYAFVEWKNGTEQFSDEREHTFEIDENLTLKAFFKPDSVMLSLDVNDPAMGKVTGAGRYRRGAKVKITAIPDTGYKFVAWKEGETEVSTNAAHTTKELTADRSLKAYFEADPVQLTLTVDDVAAGTVQGEGTYLRNKPVVIKAIANPGYRFVAWEDEEGNEFATEAEYRFNIKKTRTLKAVFVKQVTLTLTPDDPDRGTVDGAGTYDKDANATAKATPNEGYEFVGWQEDGAIVSNDAEYTFAMETDRTLTAIFAEKQVKLTLHANNDDWGSVEGEDTYGKGASVTAKAIPSDGYEFVKWMEGETQVSTESEYTFIINADRTLTAVFAERKVRLTLEVNHQGWGTVEGAKAYEKGTQVTAKATANEGYEFVEWLEDEAQVSIEAEYTFTIEADRMLTAVFAEKAPVVKDSFNLRLQVNNAAMGTVEGEGRYEKGTQVTIKATANEGYVFEAWKAGETEISKEAEYTFIVNSDSTLTAVFAEKAPVVEQVRLTLNANNSNWGTVEGADTYNKGASVTAKATPNEGYEFVEWLEDEAQVSIEAEYTFTIEADRTLTAVFAEKAPVVKDSVNLTLEVNNAAMGTVEGMGKYEKGTQVTIKATANEGYVFEAWKAGETEISKEAEYTFIVNSDSTLTAVFAEKAPVVEQVRLTLNANNSNWGTVEGADTYNKGASVTAKATANEGYEFKGWQENGATVSTEAEYTFIINADRTLTAVFAEKAPVVEQVRLTLEVNNSAWGTVEGADTYNKGASVTAKATPNEGYEFKGWQENGATVSTEAEYTFIINADRTLTAVFAAKTANEDREQAAWSAYADNQTIVLRSEVACRYEIYTVSGKKVGQGRSNGKEYRITVNNGGLYIVRRIAANGIATKKVVVW